MSKKTRKKIVRKNLAGSSVASAVASDSKPIIESALKVPSAAGKVYMSSEDLDKKYQYVKDDLKNIAIIAIPLIAILILSSFFIKI